MNEFERRKTPLSPEQLASFLGEAVTDYAFVTFDAENRITSWSKGAERILGFTEREALGRPGAIIFTEEDRARGVPEKEFKLAVAHGRADDERWHLRKDGSRFWASGVMTAVYDPGGKLTGCAKVMRDLTERRRAEAALRASEERLRLFLENVREYALFQTDLDGRITSWHPGAEQVFGYSSSEITGESLNRLLIPEDQADGVLDREMAKVARGGRVEDARWVVRKDGSRFWARWVTEPVHDPDGTLRGAAKVLRDETEREQNQQEIQASKRQLQLIANLVPDLLWSNSPIGDVTWYNQRWMDYTGQSLEQALGEGWTETVHPEDLASARQEFQEAVAAGSPFRHEHRIRRRDGVYRWFLARAEPVRIGAGAISQWFGAATDIDEQRVELDVVRDELRALAARLMTMQDEERRRIARDLHDSVGQQLAAAQADVAHARQIADAAAMGRVLAEVERRIGKLSDEVRELSHRLHPSILEDLGLTAALRSVVAEFERAHGIPVRIQLAEGPGAPPMELATVIYRIAQEALRNTGKHGGPGIEISLTLTHADGGLRLTVADTGPGFDIQAIRAKGGLGLVSMRERARLVGGTLVIDSAAGRGTKLVLTIPTPEAAPSKPTVVIADDHTTSRYILRRFAEMECLVVAEAGNGLEALEAAERHRPDLTILDVSMPVMGGIEAARLLRERFPEVRIIFASQHTGREYVEEAFRAGAQGYIVKQAAATEVPRAIREVLAGRQFRSPATEGRR